MSELVVCPRCGREVEETLIGVLKGTRDPNVKSCRSCGWSGRESLRRYFAVVQTSDNRWVLDRWAEHNGRRINEERRFFTVRADAFTEGRNWAESGC